MNRREFGKLLAELNDNLRNEIAELKTDIATTKRLNTNLKNYFDKCEDIIKKITDEETGIEAYHESTKSTKDQVEAIKVTADQRLQEISTSLESVKANVKEMEEAYDAFTAINEEITDEETGMEALLASATELKAAIETARNQSQTYLQEISTSLESVKANVKEMEEAYDAFTAINEEITDEETGMEALLASATELKSDIVAVKSNADTLYKEIRKFRDDAANYIKEIGGLKDTANIAVTEIQGEHKASLALKEKIEEIFNIGSRGVHSNYFVERRDQLFYISIFWLALFLILLGVTVLLAVRYVLPLTEVLKDPNARVGFEVFLIRFSIITPTFFAALYALKQFSNDRRLYEKYAFKAISTYSAESSVATLSRALEGHTAEGKDDKIINFAVTAFTNIYEEPIEPMRDKWVIKGGNKLLSLTTEMNQSVGEIKKDVDKLADNIPKGNSTE